MIRMKKIERARKRKIEREKNRKRVSKKERVRKRYGQTDKKREREREIKDELQNGTDFFPTSDGRRMIRKEQSEDFLYFFFFSFLHFDNPNQTFIWLDLFVNKANVQCRNHRPTFIAVL